MGNLLNRSDSGESNGMPVFPNTTNSFFARESRRKNIAELISDSTTVAPNYIDTFVNSQFNEGQGQWDNQDCFGCSDNLNGYGSSAPADNQNSSLYEASTVVFDSSVGGSAEMDNELYVIPWSIIILWCFLYGGISAAALIGNTLVMWVVTISRRMRTVTNMFIANLALADFIIGLFTIPFQFQAALLQRWNLPDFMCAFCPFVQVLSVNVSVFTLSAIAVDRYRAVLYPLSPRVSKRKAAWMILTIWTLGILIGLPTELDYKVTYVNDTVRGGKKPFCSNAGLSDTFRVYYYLCLLVIQYIFPLVILSGAYVRMTIKLWGASVPGNKEESRDAILLQNKKKVIKMLALVVILFAVCWLPLQLYNVLQFFIPSINEFKYINIIWFCFHWLAMSNSCCNPFIYAIYNDKFQREFRARLGYLSKICSFCKCQKRQGISEIMDGSDMSDDKPKSEKPGKRLQSKDERRRRNNQNVSNNVAHYEMTTEFNQREQQSVTKRARNKPSRNSSRRSSTKAAISNESSRKNTTSENFCIEAQAASTVLMDGMEASNVPFTHQLADMKKESENGSQFPSARQTAVVCSNSRVLTNSPQVTVTVVATDKMCHL